MTTKYGLWAWYHKPVEERKEIFIKTEIEKTAKSIVDYYTGLGELSRAMTRIRGDD